MNRRGFRMTLLATFLLATTSSASAHDTWLLPARFEVAPGADIELDFTSGMKFPEPESAVSPDRIAGSGLRVGGQRLPLQPRTPGKRALRLSATAPTPGVAVLWAASRPRTLSLTPDQVHHYLEEIGAPPAVEARWRRQQHFRESYAKLAKTYVKVGDAPDDRSWQEPVGLGLELLPLQDPTALRVGTELAVRVLRESKAVRNLTVSALPPGGGKPVATRTDRDGRVIFVLDRPGPWLVRATLIEESSAPETDWQSLFTTLSISVGKDGRGQQ